PTARNRIKSLSGPQQNTMKRTISILLASIFAIASAFAGGKTVHVNGYYKSNGTYVHAYNRSPPGTAPSTGAISTSRTTAVSSAAPPLANVSITTPASVPTTSNAPIVYV